jgi:hypothetical protein
METGRFVTRLKRGREKFVALDASGDATAAVVGLNAKDVAVTSDVDVAGKSDLLRKRENEFDGAARRGLGVGEEKQATVADVARLAVFFDDARAIGIAQAHGKHH